MIEQIGQRLKTAREMVDLTQSELAQSANVDQSTLAHWERGKTRPSPEKVALMAPVLGVSEEWLLYGRGRGPASTDADAPRAATNEGLRANPVSDRIRATLERNGLAPAALARHLGMSAVVVGEWLRADGAASPPADAIAAIARFLGVGKEWLMFGGRQEGPEHADDGRADLVQLSAAFGSVAIDELDTRVGAGAGQVIEGGVKVGQWMMPRELMKLATVAGEDRVKIVSVVGNSMAPTFSPTDRIMVDTSDRLPSPPGIFVVWDGLGLVVKRIEYIPHSDPATIRITSDNARYAPYERSLEEAHIQGRVIGKWQWS